jgi:large subunit ribosomal protein L3
MLVDGIIGRKLGMTQIFQPDGTVVPVTVIAAGPCVAVRLRSAEKDGYEAVVLGLVEPGKASRANKPQKGQFEKIKVPPTRILREFALRGEIKPGDSIGASEFEVGELVDVVAVSKGLGFQGVMRRHGFRGGASSHGSMFHRAPGSIGASAFPSRTFRGMRAAGRMGGARTTTKNLKVVQVDPERNLVLVRGAVPGPPGGALSIKRAKAGVRVKMSSAPTAAAKQKKK